VPRWRSSSSGAAAALLVVRNYSRDSSPSHMEIPFKQRIKSSTRSSAPASSAVPDQGKARCLPNSTAALPPKGRCFYFQTPPAVQYVAPGWMPCWAAGLKNSPDF
jgi:hypothetical protein